MLERCHGLTAYVCVSEVITDKGLPWLVQNSHSHGKDTVQENLEICSEVFWLPYDWDIFGI